MKSYIERIVKEWSIDIKKDYPYTRELFNVIAISIYSRRYILCTVPTKIIYIYGIVGTYRADTLRRYLLTYLYSTYIEISAVKVLLPTFT